MGRVKNIPHQVPRDLGLGIAILCNSITIENLMEGATLGTPLCAVIHERHEPVKPNSNDDMNVMRDNTKHKYEQLTAGP